MGDRESGPPPQTCSGLDLSTPAFRHTMGGHCASHPTTSGLRGSDHSQLLSQGHWMSWALQGPAAFQELLLGRHALAAGLPTRTGRRPRRKACLLPSHCVAGPQGRLTTVRAFCRGLSCSGPHSKRVAFELPDEYRAVSPRLIAAASQSQKAH